ncbi:hypothetical protein [Burkholderia stagnalis]|uniref:hypothetical protein n=1 Tax=Burkholderia stagnalis TaxID=1503054 RepID=UPI002ED92985
MEQHSQLNDSHLQSAVSLEAQLREMYVRAAYTHKTHEKMRDTTEQARYHATR